MKIRDFELKQDIMLAPMAGITDAPFRKICREMGLELAFTEMVSSRGLMYDNQRTQEYVQYSDEDAPLGIQIFGNDPHIMALATKKLENLEKFDIIDINMGCPVKKIVQNGDGCMLMKDEKLAARIVDAMRQSTDKVLSVKMRLGMNAQSINVLSFAKAMQSAGADFITVHGRTAEQMYSGKADWDWIQRVKHSLDIPVVGNGDVFSVEDYMQKSRYGLDALMIARGIQGNPFLIKNILTYGKDGVVPEAVSLEERVDTAIRHLRYVLDIKGAFGIAEFRKHAAWYFKGIPGSAHLRAELSYLKSEEQFRSLMHNLLDKKP